MLGRAGAAWRDGVPGAAGSARPSRTSCCRWQEMHSQMRRKGYPAGCPASGHFAERLAEARQEDGES